MCNCISNLENRISEELPKKNKEYEKFDIISVECNDRAILLEEDRAKAIIAIPFTIYHEPVGRKKKTIINMSAKYCPFCGEKYEK